MRWIISADCLIASYVHMQDSNVFYVMVTLLGVVFTRELTQKVGTSLCTHRLVLGAGDSICR